MYCWIVWSNNMPEMALLKYVQKKKETHTALEQQESV